jgi:large subunit ribosomal protein L10
LDSRFLFASMKTKEQKQEELKKAKDLLARSSTLLFADFTGVGAEDVRKLRAELKKNSANLLVVKKRLLGLLFKDAGIEVDLKRFKMSIGTIFSGKGTEAVAGPAFKFFAGLEVPEGSNKDVWASHLLGGYDVAAKAPIDAATIVMIGKLPSREVLLTQLLSMIAAPIRSLLYVLDQKAKITA